MTAIRATSATIATPDHGRLDASPRGLTGEKQSTTWASAHANLAYLDEPYPALATAADACASCTYRGGKGQRVMAVATVSRHLPPGPPLRGAYRIHDVAARTPAGAAGVITRCIAHAATNGGSMLWCQATLATVCTWQQHGFSVASPPTAARGGGVGVLMVRRLTPADAEF